MVGYQRIERANQISEKWIEFANAFAEISMAIERSFQKNFSDDVRKKIFNSLEDYRIVAAVNMLAITNPALVTLLSPREMLQHAECEVEQEIGKVFQIARSTPARSYRN